MSDIQQNDTTLVRNESTSEAFVSSNQVNGIAPCIASAFSDASDARGNTP